MITSEDLSEKVRNARTSTQITIGACMAMAALISVVKMASPIGMWSIVNQFQMLLLLLLTRAFIPDKIREYLLGMDFTLMNFNFIPLNEVPMISIPYDWIEYEQYDTNLQDIGVENGSTAANNLSFIVMIMMFITLHIPIAMMYS